MATQPIIGHCEDCGRFGPTTIKAVEQHDGRLTWREVCDEHSKSDVTNVVPQTHYGATDSALAHQYRDLRSMIRQIADAERFILDHGATARVVARAESLLAAIRLIVAEMYPDYDEVTRERMIAFAVAVAE